MSEIPAFLSKYLEEQYGCEAERIKSGYGKKRPVTLRANTLKCTAEEVERELARAGFAAERAPWYPDAFAVEGTEQALLKTELYRSGKIYLQSFSSMLPPLLLAPRAGENILDMTAAPGGKTTQMLALSGGGALITACEKDGIRFDRLKFNLARQGAGRVNAMHLDATRLSDFLRFDKILLDAPCSGSGSLAPKPITEALLRGCMRAQEALLTKALKLLLKGGTLVYSTCSVLKQENEEMLRKVLPRAGGTLVPPQAEFLSRLPRLKSAPDTVTVCPDEQFEGFFLAVIRK